MPASNQFQITWYIGAMADAGYGAYEITFMLPMAVQLTHVSLVCTSTDVGTLEIGTSADADGYLKAETFTKDTPTEVSTIAGFDGVLADGQFPHIAQGTIIKVTVNDHADAHMTGVGIVMTFTEG